MRKATALIRSRRRRVATAGRRAAALGGLALAALAAAAPARACGIALALAVDVSSSVDRYEYQLQTGGMAAAFRDPEVADAILGGGGALVAVVYWSGYPHQESRIGWTPLGDAAAIAAFADRIDRLERRYAQFPTAIGRALQFVETLWSPETAACARRVVDVSGDGVNNSGPPPVSARRRLVARGITLNALVIQGEWPDPEPYYRDNVIGGPGAFIEIADGYDDFARAFRRKLLRELQPLAADLAHQHVTANSQLPEKAGDPRTPIK